MTRKDTSFGSPRSVALRALRVSFLGAVVVMLPQCRRPLSRTLNPPASANSSVELSDSIRVVKVAIDSFYAVLPPNEREPVRVTSFAADRDGYSIRISWVTAAGVVETGGGALVRVDRRGVVQSMVLYQ